MNVAIMQPYLFPHLAYFQLVQATDRFVIYDDAQWIQRGWINRNRILLDDKPHLFTFSVASGSSRTPIRERHFADRIEKEIPSFLKTLRHAYGKAPHYEETANLVRDILHDLIDSPRNIAQDIAASLRRLTDHLSIASTFDFSSNIRPKKLHDGEDHIIALCQSLNASTYTNPSGGKSLYTPSSFAEAGIKLRFLESRNKGYPQQTTPFIPDLSIIDVLMFNDKDETRKLLSQYELVRLQEHEKSFAS